MSINNLSDFKIALVSAFETRVPTLFLGAPGSAKTAAMISIAEKIGGKMIPVLCSTMTPSDVLGFPYRDQEYSFKDDYNEVKGALKFSPPYWALQAIEAAASGKYKFVALFFDELYTATPSVQAALLRPLNEGYVGDLYIGHIIRIAAANAKGQSSGFNISQALQNRFVSYNLNPTLQDWVDDFMLEKELEINYDAWDGSYKGMLMDLYEKHIKTNQITLVEGDQVPNGAFASKRSITMLTKLLSFAAQNGLRETFVKQLITGTVGSDKSQVLTEFYESHKKFTFMFDFKDNYTPADVQRFFDNSYQVFLKQSRKLTKEQQQKLSQLYVEVSKRANKNEITVLLDYGGTKDFGTGKVRDFEVVLEKNSVILSEMLNISKEIINTKLPDLKEDVEEFDVSSIFGDIDFVEVKSDFTKKYPNNLGINAQGVKPPSIRFVEGVDEDFKSPF